MSPLPADAPLAHRGPAAVREHLPLARRSAASELLDAPDVDRTELTANLRDLTRLNRLPGGAASSIAAIERLVDGSADASILDVGTGAGDLPLAFTANARRRWTVIAVDNREDVLEHALRATRREPSIQIRRGDALDLPLEDASVDVAHASLLLHHLDPDEAVTALREMRRVARRGVVINDLRRGLLAFALAAPVVMLGTSRMTRHDGLISLRRAYTLEELDEMLAEAGLGVRWRSLSFMPRVVTAARRRPGT